MGVIGFACHTNPHQLHTKIYCCSTLFLPWSNQLFLKKLRHWNKSFLICNVKQNCRKQKRKWESEEMEDREEGELVTPSGSSVTSALLWHWVCSSYKTPNTENFACFCLCVYVHVCWISLKWKTELPNMHILKRYAQSLDIYAFIIWSHRRENNCACTHIHTVYFDKFTLTKRGGISEITCLSTHLLCQQGLITHCLTLADLRLPPD